VQELQSYFRPALPGQTVRAVPGEGLAVPIWLLGSSTFSGQLAALLGLPFAFASHFAPDYLFDALELYRNRFQPSPALDKPYVMLGVNVFAADTDAEAARLFTSLQQAFINLRRGQPGPLQPPVDSLEGFWSPIEKAGVEHALRYAVVGSRETVRRGLAAFIEETGADELMITAQIYDHEARLRSFETAAEVRDNLADSAATAA
jgi:luciferase family oxidoreductase group 1